MLHHHHNQIQTQTLLLSTSSFISPFHFQSQSQYQSPPPSSSSSSSYYSRPNQVEREKRMESSAVAAEFSFYFGSRGIQGQEAGGFDGVGACDDMAWVVENGNVLGLGDDFVVDDLLDFGQLETTQSEAEGEDDDDNTNTNTNTKEEEEEHQNRNKKHHEIQQQQQGKEESLGEDNSAVSFEPIPMPVSELTLPAHDAAELEWVSRIMDDSLSEFQTYSAPKPYFPPQHMHMPMPMHMSMPMLTIPVKAKRSKRARSMSWSSSCSSSSSWGSGVPLLFMDSSSSTTTSSASSSSCSSSSYSSSSSKQQQQQIILGHQVCDEIPVSVFPHHPPHNYIYGRKILNCVTLKKQKARKKGKGKGKGKKRGRKAKKSVVVVVVVGEGGGERQCRHCGVNKTPQWRTGPEGAKTLCNACGVRYKSGRLLPEYRPACSPSFLNHVHSNSHRKVIEMRRNKGEEQELSSTFPLPSFSSSTPPLCSAAWVN